MEIPKIYDSKAIERKWRKEWIKKKTFSFTPGSNNFVIDHPPAFTSGTLHMGHILDYSWIDIVARYKRLRGFNVLLPIGFDCHGLPTELRVEHHYGVKKDNRKEFLEKCSEWTGEAIKDMKEQYEKLGYSCDWDSLYVTMSKEYKRLVQLSLLKMFDQGLVYRSEHPVPWCTKCRTALAKAEVGYIEKQGCLWYIKLRVENSKETVTIATTRPELMPACIAVMVHPKDKRYKYLHGKRVEIPYTGRSVPVITEDFVDMDFGTGAVYHCTFGDEDDVKWQIKYRLPVYRVIGEDGIMTELAGKYSGMKVKKAQEAIVQDLKGDGYIAKEEPFMHNVICHTERSSCNNPIEFIPIPQFFIKVKPFLKEILSNGKRMKWYPEYMRSHLIDWTRSMDWDWIISRQRVFGTPIPFWYCKKCGKIKKPREDQLPVNPLIDKIGEKCECGGELEGSKDVCDCWVDSSITPLVISRWTTDNRFFSRAYPNSIRIQGFEIIRTWLFYTLFRCFKLTGKIPWPETLQHGNVLSVDGKKMSKSLGNVIDPNEAFEKYGADALRQWVATASMGEDLAFTWKEMEHSKKFLTKLWNISRFVQFNIKTRPKRGDLKHIDEWILSRLNRIIEQATKNMDSYVFNIPIQEVRSFLWHDFADYYLEFVKYRLNGKDKNDSETVRWVLYSVLWNSIRLLSPFTPFITEELYHSFFKRYEKGESIHTISWPKTDKGYINKDSEELGELAKDITSALRKYKTSKGQSLKAPLKEVVIGTSKAEPILRDIRNTMNIQNIKTGRGGEIRTERFDIGLTITQ